jgi:hypothetical protein
MSVFKSLLLVAGTWLSYWIAWLMLLAVTAVASGKSHGAQLTVSMAVLFLGALAMAIASVVVVKIGLWRTMPAGGGRMLLVVGFAVAQAVSYLVQGFFSLIAFDR